MITLKLLYFKNNNIFIDLHWLLVSRFEMIYDAQFHSSLEQPGDVMVPVQTDTMTDTQPANWQAEKENNKFHSELPQYI